MFAAERRNRIREILLEYRHVDVNTLCSLLGVSVATVRRDLDQLEGEGFLVKEHGGALLSDAQSAANDVLLNLNADLYSVEKREIAAVAARLVREKTAIFIGAGTTCLAFARALPDLPGLTVVTCNLQAAAELVGRGGVSTILLGGDMQQVGGLLSTYGMYAETNIDNMYVDQAFLSADGASVEAGYTMSVREQVPLCRRVMRRAEETVMLADSGKFGKRALVPFAPLRDLRTVVSDNRLDERVRTYFVEHGVRLYTAL